jgi:hypothetical protein
MRRLHVRVVETRVAAATLPALIGSAYICLLSHFRT